MVRWKRSPRRPTSKKSSSGSSSSVTWAMVATVTSLVGVSFLLRNKTEMPDPSEALPGRDTRPFHVPESHFVLGTPLEPPFPEDTEQLIVGMGCFWGAERVFWQAPGVYTTAVGYAGGHTPNPSYEEVCSGRTGHAEVVLVVFDPD